MWVGYDSSLSANNGALHSVINAAGFWKALWKSEAVGADDVEGASEGMWQYALQQLRAVEGLHDTSPCASADDARAMLQRAHCSGCPAFGAGAYEHDFSFMRLSQRRSFKVEPSLLEWICFSRTSEAISITCVPVVPPPHVLNGRPPSSYLPMCDTALPPNSDLSRKCDTFAMNYLKSVAFRFCIHLQPPSASDAAASPSTKLFLPSSASVHAVLFAHTDSQVV